MPQHIWGDAVRIVVLALLWVATARMAVTLDTINGFAAILWPPTGISIAALLIHGCRMWIGVVLGALVFVSTAYVPLLAAEGIVVSNTVEALLGAYLLRRFQFDTSLKRIRDVALLAGVALLCGLVSSVIGMTEVWITDILPGASILGAGVAWWMGNFAGALVVLPLILVWYRSPPQPRIWPKRTVEFLCLIVATVFLGMGIFSDLFSRFSTLLSRTFLVFPVLLWAAARFQQRGVTLVIFLITVTSFWGRSLILEEVEGGIINGPLTHLQFFLATVSLCGLIVAALVASLLDERDRIQSEHERFDKVASATHLGVWYTDLPWVKFDWNGIAKEHFWLEPSAEVTIAVALERIHPDDRETAMNAFEHSLVAQAAYDVEFRTVNPEDPNEFKWIRSVGWTDSDARGEPVRFDGLTLDITEQKKTVEALRGSENLFRTLTRLAPVGIFIADEQVDCTFVNERWTLMTGFTAEQTMGKGLGKALHPDDVQRVAQEWLASIPHGKEFHCEYRFITAWGKVLWVSGSGIALRDPDGKVLGYLGTLTDITSIREKEEALREALRARDEFLSIASHELKTPLTTLNLQCQMLAKGVESGDPKSFSKERVKKAAEQSERQVVRLTRLVNDMLDIARIRTGRLGIRTEQVDFCDVVRDVIERLQGEFVASGYPSPEFVCEGPVVGEWDRFRLEQVVINLLTNALKYGKGRPVRVRLEQRDSTARLTVEDEGIGIAAEHQERIFGRFERAISATEVSGLGLGLFITRQIVEAHHGRIWVESEAGKGARFVVEIPGAAQRRAELPKVG